MFSFLPLRRGHSFDISASAALKWGCEAPGLVWWFDYPRELRLLGPFEHHLRERGLHFFLVRNV